jgi:hypothetical protein
MRVVPNGGRWAIPGVGVFQMCFDRVRIVSTASVGVLKTLLPIDPLKAVSHSFDITTERPHRKLRSVITVVCANDCRPLLILKQHAALLRNYRITQVEIALDQCDTSDSAVENMRNLLNKTTKLRHRRRRLRSVHNPDQTPPAGCLSEPTVYYEARRSSVSMKCYSRQRKLPGGSFGERHARLESTLTGARAITGHLGGNKIEHLLEANFGGFLERNLRLERVDYVALGYVLRGIRRDKRPNGAESKSTPIRERLLDPDYRARRIAFIALRWLACREEAKFANWDQALWLVRTHRRR